MRNDNYVGVEKLLDLNVVENGVLNEMSYVYQAEGSVDAHIVLGWCHLVGKGVEWIDLLRSYNAR
jgi:hypothetical protein